MLSITTRKRWPGWTASLSDDAGIWEAGQTEVEAIGKLVISLDTEARAKHSIIYAVLAWFAIGRHIRVERR